VTIARAGRLFVVRHGRTAATGKFYVGWGDPPLDDVGAAQAVKVLETLRDESIDIVYSSPLVRAIETARPLTALRRLEIRLRPAMREIHYGDYKGVAKETRRLELRTEHRYQRMPGGESLFDLYRRVNGFSAELARTLRAGFTTVVVGHYWSNRMLVGCLARLPFDVIVDAPLYKPGNGSVLEVLCRRTTDFVALSRAVLRRHDRDALPANDDSRPLHEVSDVHETAYAA
jgi:broad specificity phosphatase PhoE